MRILVTGGAGFIGSHLVDVLEGQGHDVIVYDDLSTGSLDNLTGPARHAYHRHDVREFFGDETCDQIYHLACPASPVQYLKDGVRTLESAVWGTRQALICAVANQCPIVIASTSEVYGDPHEHPQPEAYAGYVNPTHRRSCYKEGKRAAETLALAWGEQYSVDVRIARIFNTYGPRMLSNDGRLVSSLVTKALRGEPMVLHGSGRQTRSFCYVSDTVRALVALMNERQVLHEDRRERVFNIGNPSERTIRSVAEDVARHIPGATIEHWESLEEQTGEDPARRCPLIDRAQRVLGWTPEVTWEDGLAMTVQWFKSHVRLEAA